MKLVLTVKGGRAGSEWKEEYDSMNLTAHGHFGRRKKDTISIVTMAEAKAWGKALVDWFNDTRHPTEAKRELISVELLPNNVLTVSGGREKSNGY